MKKILLLWFIPIIIFGQIQRKPKAEILLPENSFESVDTLIVLDGYNGQYSGKKYIKYNEPYINKYDNINKVFTFAGVELENVIIPKLYPEKNIVGKGINRVIRYYFNDNIWLSINELWDTGYIWQRDEKTIIIKKK